MLGNDKCGKTSLVNRMCKSEKPFCSSALEYRFLNVQADMKDSSYAYQLGSAGATFGPSDSINLPVHMLAGCQEFVPLLKFAMPKELTKCCFVLMASIIPPEEIIPSLEAWYRAVVGCIKQHYTPEQIEAGKQAREFLEFYSELYFLFQKCGFGRNMWNLWTRRCRFRRRDWSWILIFSISRRMF